MRRVTLAIASTVTGLVLLLGFKTQSTGTSVAAAPPAAVSPSGTGSSASTGTGSTSTGSTAGSTSGTGSTSTASPSASSSGSTTSGTRTVTGAAADTRYGPVQVQVTITNGKVTAVQAVEYPTSEPRDEQINSYAIPQLNQEATAAKSAQIDTVSGATYTSEGYITSLQSALDQAGVA